MAKSSSRRNPKKTVGCPVELTLEAIGGRWKVLVIHYLLEETKRFGDFTRLLKGISARTLTKQLRELESHGIVRRYVYRQIPLKVEYSLTSLGLKLKPILFAMHDWGDEFEKRRNRAK